jgi:glycosyltransferase involved in cell wall biosynthesis
VLCGVPAATEKQAGFTFVPLTRHGLAPLGDLTFAFAVRQALRRFRPDAVHLITIKPVLYGGLVLRFFGRKGIRWVGTFAGLGRLFDEGQQHGWSLRLIRAGLRLAFAHPAGTVVFENEGDQRRFRQEGLLDAARSAVLPGAGLPTADFPKRPLPPGRLQALFAGRLLKAKGIEAFLSAAQLAREHGAGIDFVVAGWSAEDPDALPLAVLQRLHGSGTIRFEGKVPMAGMADLIARCHLLVLPTRYNEGLPRILCEAASLGRPSVVSNNPGCLAFVSHERNGLVLENVTGEAILAALRRLDADRTLLSTLAEAAAQHVRQGGFDIADIAARYRELYTGA